MDLRMGKLFTFEPLKAPDGGEVLEILASGENCAVERIVSAGQVTPEGRWYDQERDEWVALLQGEARLLWDDGAETFMTAGGWILIPAHARHRVIYTSSEPPCLWVAFHFKGDPCPR